MQLILIRHGKADLEFTNDNERELTLRGKMQVERLANWLRQYELNDPQMWHSGKLRAFQTAEVVREKTGWFCQLRPMDELRPEAKVEPIVEMIRNEDRDLVIVSHMPLLSEITAELLGHGPGKVFWEFGTAGALVLQRDGFQDWIVQGFVRPSMLKSKAD